MALNACNRKEEITPEKEVQAEHNSRRINEIIKIRMEIIKMENRKKSVFWKKAQITKLKRKRTLVPIPQKFKRITGNIINNLYQ